MDKNKLDIKFDDGRYVDGIGRNIIIDRIGKCIYVVPKSDNKKYNVMRARNAFVIAIGMAMMAFVSIPVGLIALVVSFAIAETIYRLFFLKRLQKITDIELPSKPTALERYATDNNGTMILMCILSIALLVVLPLYIKQEVGSLTDAIQFKNIGWSIIVYGSVVLCALAVYLIYTTISILIRRSKKK